MMHTFKKTIATATALCALTVMPLAQAELLTFDIKWKSQESAAIAVGELTLDSKLIKTAYHPPESITTDKIVRLNITVTGSQFGSGKFSKEDFSSINFYTRGAVNFQQELIGQTVTITGDPALPQYRFGDSAGQSGAFDLAGLDVLAPTTVRPFSIITGTDDVNEFSDLLSITSIKLRDSVSPVPEPATYAMLLAGLGLVAVRARRGKQG